MIKGYMKGNLVRLMQQAVNESDGTKLFFAHGCNCHAAMGSGIAPQIAKAFPQVEETDRLYNKVSSGYLEDMLGSAFPVCLSGNVTLFNAYTQFYPGKDFRINALTQAFENINIMAKGQKLLIPRIGAGIAGGDWDEISEAINKATPDVNVFVIDWDGTL